MPRWEWTLSLFNISLSLVSEVKRQRSVPEDLKRAAEERGALTETEGRKPTEDEVLKCIFKFSVRAVHSYWCCLWHQVIVGRQTCTQSLTSVWGPERFFFNTDVNLFFPKAEETSQIRLLFPDNCKIRKKGNGHSRYTLHSSCMSFSPNPFNLS